MFKDEERDILAMYTTREIKGMKESWFLLGTVIGCFLTIFGVWVLLP